MADDQPIGNQPTGMSGLDWLFTVLGGVLTKDPFAYPKFKMGMQRGNMEDLFRKAQMQRWKEEEEQGNRPATLPIIGKQDIPSGGVLPGNLPEEAPQYDVPTETRQQIGVQQVPIPGYRMKDVAHLGGLASLARVYGLGPQEAETTEEFGYGQRRGTKTGKVTQVPVKPEKEPTKKSIQHVQEDRGDAYRTGTFDPRESDPMKAYTWGQWQSKKVAPQKPTKEQAPEGKYKSIETTYERRRKQIESKYRLTEAEYDQAISGKGEESLEDLLGRKGLSKGAAAAFKAELDDLDNVREQMLTDIEEGKDPNLRLKTIGKGLKDKKTEGPTGKIQTLPEGSKQVGTYKGKKVYELPDGTRFMEE
jgi:hypothetical protein